MTRAPQAGVVNRGAWTAEEDLLLRKYIEANGVGRWSTLPLKAGLMRCGKSCRLRWMNHLRPNVKRGHISPDEEDLIIRLHNLLGNRWSLIAGRVPGRTDNEVKNYWNTHLSKKLPCRSFAQIVQGQPLSFVDHQKTKAKGSIDSFDDHTHNLRFSTSPVSPKDSKESYLRDVPGSQSADATLKCSVTELPPSDKERTDLAILEDDLHSSAGNMEADMANFLQVPWFEESMSTTELWSDSFISSWTWFDNLFCENDFGLYE